MPARWMSYGALIALAVLAAPGTAGGQSRRTVSPTHGGDTCVVLRVVDGDTFRCRDGTRVRLLLIDSPERDQKPFGRAAAAELARLLPAGSKVLLETDVQPCDRYRRRLAYVRTSDGVMVNEQMLRRGYAVVTVYPPNVRHVERFRRASRVAQAAKAGLWATDAFACSPRDHRAKRC